MRRSTASKSSCRERCHDRWGLALVGARGSSRSAAASAPATHGSSQPRARRAISGHWLSGALLWRLRVRWTRHRWRSARGKQVSTARIRPAPRRSPRAAGRPGRSVSNPRRTRAACRVLLRARRQVQQTLRPVRSPRRRARPRVASPRAGDRPRRRRKVGDRGLAEVPACEGLVVLPQRSVTSLTAVRLSTLAPLASRKAASMSRVLSPRAYISTASCSSSAVPPARPARTRETNGSARSATCGRRSRSRPPGAQPSR